MTPDHEDLLAKVYGAVRTALGLSDAEAAPRVLRAFSDPSQPRPPRDAPVCYYRLVPAPGPGTPDQLFTAPAPDGRSVSRSVLRQWPCALELTFYGPDAVRDALNARSRMAADGPGSPRELLRPAGVLPGPAPMPCVLWEEEGTARRIRADLSVPLLITDEDASGTLPAVTEPPRVVIHTER